jgi:predicted transcriptional regulator with HTH domain
LLTNVKTLLYKYIQIMSKQVQNTLTNLFSSAIRAEVLALLLNNSEERFYVREIATLLRKNPSGVKRELDNLEKMGILISKRVANLKYFQAEKKSPLFAELKNLIAKSQGIHGALKALLKTSNIKIAFIYGPYAESEDADTVNLLIIGVNSLHAESISDVEEKFGKKVHISVIDETEFKSRKESGDIELEKLLSGNKIMLMGKL